MAKFKVQDGLNDIGNFTFIKPSDTNYISITNSETDKTIGIFPGNSNSIWLFKENGTLLVPGTGNTVFGHTGHYGAGIKRGETGNANKTVFSIDNITNSGYQDASSCLWVTRANVQADCYISEISGIVADVQDGTDVVNRQFISNIKTKLTSASPRSGKQEFYTTTNNFEKLAMTLEDGKIKLPENGSITFPDNTTQITAFRRKSQFVASDTAVTFENIEAKVLSATNQLQVYLNSGTWQATGWTNTYQGGSAATQYWANVPISDTTGPNGNGYTMSGAMTTQGYGCELTFSDQTNLNKTYKITVIKAGTTGNQWSITIERLV